MIEKLLVNSQNPAPAAMNTFQRGSKCVQKELTPPGESGNKRKIQKNTTKAVQNEVMDSSL